MAELLRTPQDPLQEMAAQIRYLDAAAEQIVARIAEAANRLREGQTAAEPATEADLLAGLAAALIDRTDEIRADCGRLSALMERTANLVVATDRRAGDG
jgi:protein-L-isoaspartate O-methyltransferase